MKYLLAIMLTNFFLLGTSLGQSASEESLIENLLDKSIKTSTYQSVEYNSEGKELNESIGYSYDSWELEELDGELILNLKNGGELMESYVISDYRTTSEGILYLRCSETDNRFWFYEDYILVESYPKIHQDVEDLLGYNYTWFYYN